MTKNLKIGTRTYARCWLLLCVLALLTACQTPPQRTSDRAATPRDNAAATLGLRVHASPWDGVDKNVARTALRRKTAISCHNCYNGPNNEIFPLTAANSKVSDAVNRGADLIELDLSDRSNSGAICVTHLSGGGACLSGEPRLFDMLNNSTLRDSNAMLFLEIKSRGSSAKHFARKLFDMIINGKNSSYAQPGRPVYIRAFASQVDGLSGIRNELFSNSKYSTLRQRIRFSVLYGERSNDGYWGGKGSIASLQSAIHADVYERGFDMVELNYQIKDILGAIKYAESLGLATGIWTVPEGFGEVFIAALREEVDEITTEYRVDLARDVVANSNTLAHLNTWPCNHSNWARYSYNFTGVEVSEWTQLNVSPTAKGYGTPGSWEDPVGHDRFGCSLDFRSKQSLAKRALPLDDRDNLSTGGFLVTAYVNFDNLSALLEGTMAIVNKSQNSGFALELHQQGSKVFLRFGVHIAGSYRYHSYDVNDTNLGGANNRLNGRDGYLLIGAYDGNGGVYLWIDNRRRNSGGSYIGGVTENNEPILIGADPEPGRDLKARFFFDGLVQQVSVLRWGDHNREIN